MEAATRGYLYQRGEIGMIYVLRMIGALLCLALTLLCVVMFVRSGSDAWLLAAIVSAACAVGTLGR
jgi:hypothetical protein